MKKRFSTVLILALVIILCCGSIFAHGDEAVQEEIFFSEEEITDSVNEAGLPEDDTVQPDEEMTESDGTGSDEEWTAEVGTENEAVESVTTVTEADEGAALEAETEAVAEETAQAEEETAGTFDEETAETDSGETADAELELTDEEPEVTAEPKNGFVFEDDRWGWYAADVLQAEMTGLINGTIDGVTGWFYIENGVYTEKTGITGVAGGNTADRYYVENGKFAKRTGVAHDVSGGTELYFVKNGVYTKATGLAKSADNSSSDWYYVKDGVFATATGITKLAGVKSNKWYYVENGIFTPATGFCRKADRSDSKWYYVEEGGFKKFTGLARRADGSNDLLYLAVDGIFTRATGIVPASIDGVDSWYYVWKGVYYEATGLTLKADHSTDKNYYYVKNGKYKKASGVARKIDGKDTDYWVVVSGKLDRDYNGGFIYKGTAYRVSSGRVTEAADYTGLIGSGSRWYYYADGSRTNVTGIVKGTVNNKTGWWYVENGTVNFSKNGTYESGIRVYNITDGRAVSCNYYFFDTEIDLPSGGYELSTNNIGIKVVKVNQRVLGVTSAYYTYETANAVMAFQSNNGLAVTGVVDIYTWLTMGFSEYDWYNLGTYTTGLKTNAFSTVAELRNAMVRTASEYAYAGTYYAAGASGAPGTYIDCSGLIYQCLYSIGINPDTNIVMHAQAQYEYTSAYLAVDGKLGLVVSTDSLKTGDLLFYAHTGDYTVVHVAIYAGDGMIYDSWPGLGVTYRSMYIAGYSVIKAIRPV